MSKRNALKLLFFFGLCLSVIASPIMQKDAWADKKSDWKLQLMVRHLEKKVEELEYKLGVQEDIEAIRTLMYSYTYYMDRALYSQVLDLFSDDAESCEVGGRGVYLGKEGCETLWMDIFGGAYGGAEDKLKYGWMVEHNVSKLVVTVSPDRKTAKSRGNYFSFGGIFNYPQYAGIQTGIYYLEYVNEDGVWKISKWWLPLTTTGYNFSTWATNPSYSGCPSAEFPPDLPTTFYHPFPEVYVVPFHYPNPVTGKEIPQNGYIDPKRYWIGNWPDDWGQDRCGVPREMPLEPAQITQSTETADVDETAQAVESAETEETDDAADDVEAIDENDTPEADQPDTTEAQPDSDDISDDIVEADE